MLKVSLHTASPTKSYPRKCSWSSKKPHRNHRYNSHYSTLSECPRSRLEHMCYCKCCWILQDFFCTLSLTGLSVMVKKRLLTTWSTLTLTLPWSIHPSSSSLVFKGKEGEVFLSTLSQKGKAGERTRSWLPNSSCWQPILHANMLPSATHGLLEIQLYYLNTWQLAKSWKSIRICVMYNSLRSEESFYPDWNKPSGSP